MSVPGNEAQLAVRTVTDHCRSLATQISQLQATFVSAVRELDEMGGFLGGLTTAQHLSNECQLLPIEARRLVRLARRLPKTPLLQQAFTEGRLSEGTAVLLNRVANADNEAKLLETAEQTNAAQPERVVRTYRSVKPAVDADAEQTPPPPPDETLSFGVRDDGMWHASATLTPEHGAQIESAIRAAQSIVGRGEPFISQPEALVRVAQSFLSGGGTTVGVVPGRFLTVLHVDRNGEAHVQGGGPVDRETADQMRCEGWASVLNHWLDPPAAA